MKKVTFYPILCLLICCIGSISAQDVLIDFGSSWKYYDAGNEPSGSWENTGYNDAAWNSGNAQLGYGDGDETTILNNTAYTLYFRKSFNVNNAAAYTNIDLDLVYDDGAVIYINGTEVWRVNMPTGTITYNTFTPTQPADNSTISNTIANSLVNGTNVIAVEVHQRSASSSDITFDLKATANLGTPSSNYISYGANWKYFDLGSEPSGSWENIGYNDVTWSSGNAELGYGDGDEATVVGFGGDGNNKYITTYFRHTFNASGFNPSDYLELNLKRDDGAVVYLNGTEVMRDGMPNGTINYSTLASVTQGSSAETTPVSTLVSANLLNSGTNVIAIEIHQAAANSSDITMDFEMNNVGLVSTSITRGPYLQKGTPSSIVVKWRTSSPTASYINFGTTLGNLNLSVNDLTPKTDHEIEITGLSANTKYFYEVGTGNATLVNPAVDVYFKTSPTPGSSQPITAWILGDCGTKDVNQRNVRDAYYNYIGSSHTDMILFLGDNAYDSGTDSEYQNAIFENMYEDKLKSTVSWSTLGNHDGYSASSSSQSGPYYDIFSFPTSGEAGGLASGTEAYYSYDYGNIHFIVLESYDTDRSIGGAMYNWCLADIQNTTAEWIVAFWHHPPYTKGSHDSDTEGELIDMRANFLPMLESNGVDLVLSGHSHSYERSYFLNGHYGSSGSFNINSNTVGATGNGDGKIDGDGAYSKETTGPLAGDGAVYITAGSSGKVTGSLTQHNAMYEFLYQRGSVVLEVDGSIMDVKFIHESGSINDYFTIEKPNQDCGNGNFVGDSCDDGDPCTTGDVYNSNCNCVGTTGDDDGDGVCNVLDQCPGLDDALIGTACDDGNTCTSNDTYDANCGCTGTPDIDTDGDGICDANDQCPGTDDALIGTSCDDGNASTSNDIYDNSCNCVGTPCPTAGTACNDGNPQTINDVEDGNCNCAGIPGGVPLTTCISITSGQDDVEENENTGAVYNNSSDIELVYDTYQSADNQTIGLRFNNVNVPQGANIVSAYIQFTVDEVSTGASNLTIRAEATDNASAFTTTAYSISSLPTTSASANWSPADWNTVGQAGVDQQTVDIGSVIQEIVSRPGFAANNSITLIITGTGSRIAESYNGSAADAPELCIDYFDQCTDSDGDGICDANDQCPGTNDALIGTACDDGNACTTNDIYDNNCNCAGTFQDADSDGVCDANDQCPGTNDALMELHVTMVMLVQ
ncbi:MAG: metallophosphoesterase family protein [Chitinophagales bacterium]